MTVAALQVFNALLQNLTDDSDSEVLKMNVSGGCRTLPLPPPMPPPCAPLVRRFTALR